MRIAAIYDIHGNLPALDAVLREIRRARVDLIVVGGDVLPGPMPVETLARLLHLDVPTRFIQGNGDREVLAAMNGSQIAGLPEQALEAVHWVARQLSPQDQKLLAGWPKTLRVPVPDVGDVLFCHATPRSDTEIFTRLTPDDRLLPLFQPLDASMIVCGHTHMQFDRTIGTTRVLNAGSVGMPFGEPGAYWLLFEPHVTLCRTTYNLAEAAARVRKTQYPQAEYFAEHHVLNPPSEAAVLGMFAKAELK